MTSESLTVFLGLFLPLSAVAVLCPPRLAEEEEGCAEPAAPLPGVVLLWGGWAGQPHLSACSLQLRSLIW